MYGLLSAECCFLLSLLPAILLCILVPILLLRKAQLRTKLPPGPRALPIIGHLHLLGVNPPQTLYNLSKIYGPLMSLRLGSVPLIVASTPDMAKQILQTHDQTFSSRPQPAAAIHLHGCTDIVFSPPGPYWKFMRQICMADLLSNKRLESFRPLIKDEVGALMRSIVEVAGTPVPVRAKLYTATSNIISRMALGKRLSELSTSSQADPSHNIVALLVEAIRLLGVFNVGDYIPSLAWMDLQGCVRQTKVVAGKLSTVLQEVIDGRRDMIRQSNGPPQADLLDILLSPSLAAKHKDIQMKDDNIKAILTDMFAGGTDTSSITIEWALGELLANPKKMKIVQEELGCIVGTSRLVQESDIPHLPYLRGVVKETMRLHPILPLLVPHMSSQPCKIYGYEIPTNTLAYVNVWAIGRDPNVWDRPLEFSPERFLDSNVDVRGQHFELLPFGSGRRACPGWMLGLSNVQFSLASLLHGFDWTTTDVPDMSEKFGIVMALANPLVAVAMPKLPKYLYEAHM